MTPCPSSEDATPLYETCPLLLVPLYTGESGSSSASRLASTFGSEYTSDMGSYASRPLDSLTSTDSPHPSPLTAPHRLPHSLDPLTSSNSSHPSPQAASAPVHSASGSESTAAPRLGGQQKLSVGPEYASSDALSYSSLAKAGAKTRDSGKGRGLDIPYSVSTVIPQAPRGWGEGGGASNSAELKWSDTRVTGMTG